MISFSFFNYFPFLESNIFQFTNHNNLLNIDYLKKFNPKHHYLGEIRKCGHSHYEDSCVRFIKKETACLQCIKERTFRSTDKRRKTYEIYRSNPEVQKRKKEYAKLYNSKPEVKERKKIHGNKEASKIKRKEYREQRETKDRKNNNKKEKYKTDFSFRYSNNISVVINRSLDSKKNGEHWENLVGYTCISLQEHLNKLKPNENPINEKDHIDHIIPQSWFKFNTYFNMEFKLCWSLKNLQLLNFNQNLVKNDKYAGSPTHQIVTKKEFNELKELFPIKLLCNCIWNEYYRLLKIPVDLKNY